jgi:ribosomal protein S7
MIIDFTDITLGVTQNDFTTPEHLYNYKYISQRGNILSGGNKRENLTFFEKVCNYMMKQARNSGKKEMCFIQLNQILEKISSQTGLNSKLVFLKAIFNGMPFRSIRRERRGSGKITRAVYLTPGKKLIFALTTITKELAGRRKRNKSYVDSFVREIILAYEKDNSSILLIKRKEAEAYADSSNY